jgi:hypothetical protein
VAVGRVASRKGTPIAAGTEQFDAKVFVVPLPLKGDSGDGVGSRESKLRSPVKPGVPLTIQSLNSRPEDGSGRLPCLYTSSLVRSRTAPTGA